MTAAAAVVMVAVAVVVTVVAVITSVQVDGRGGRLCVVGLYSTCYFSQRAVQDKVRKALVAVVVYIGSIFA